jgi:hypothetical protein
MESMTLSGVMASIRCPVLAVTGEYDPRGPLDEVYELFDQLACPAELWVFADQHHKASLTQPNGEDAIWRLDIHEMATDWLFDRLQGKALVDRKRVVYLEPGGSGPYAADVRVNRNWYDD